MSLPVVSCFYDNRQLTTEGTHYGAFVGAGVIESGVAEPGALVSVGTLVPPGALVPSGAGVFEEGRKGGGRSGSEPRKIWLPLTIYSTGRLPLASTYRLVS